MRRNRLRQNGHSTILCPCFLLLVSSGRGCKIDRFSGLVKQIGNLKFIYVFKISIGSPMTDRSMSPGMSGRPGTPGSHHFNPQQGKTASNHIQIVNTNVIITFYHLSIV